MKRSRKQGRKEELSGSEDLSRLLDEDCSDSAEVLRALNSIPVSEEDLWRVGQELRRRCGAVTLGEGYSTEDVLAVVRERFGDTEPEKGCAVLYRFEALTSLLASEPPLQLNDAFVAAAAIEPIIAGTEFTFHRESFLRRVRELSAHRGTALHR